MEHLLRRTLVRSGPIPIRQLAEKATSAQTLAYLNVPSSFDSFMRQTFNLIAITQFLALSSRGTRDLWTELSLILCIVTLIAVFYQSIYSQISLV